VEGYLQVDGGVVEWFKYKRRDSQFSESACDGMGDLQMFRVP